MHRRLRKNKGNSAHAKFEFFICYLYKKTTELLNTKNNLLFTCCIEANLGNMAARVTATMEYCAGMREMHCL